MAVESTSCSPRVPRAALTSRLREHIQPTTEHLFPKNETLLLVLIAQMHDIPYVNPVRLHSESQIRPLSQGCTESLPHAHRAIKLIISTETDLYYAKYPHMCNPH